MLVYVTTLRGSVDAVLSETCSLITDHTIMEFNFTHRGVKKGNQDKQDKEQINSSARVEMRSILPWAQATAAIQTRGAEVVAIKPISVGRPEHNPSKIKTGPRIIVYTRAREPVDQSWPLELTRNGCGSALISR